MMPALAARRPWQYVGADGRSGENRREQLDEHTEAIALRNVCNMCNVCNVPG